MVIPSVGAFCYRFKASVAMSFLSFLTYIVLGCVLAYVLARALTRRLRLHIPGKKLRYLKPYTPTEHDTRSTPPCE